MPGIKDLGEYRTEKLARSHDMVDRMAFRLFSAGTAELPVRVEELRLYVEVQRGLGASALAGAIKEKLQKDGYIVQDDVDVMLENQLEADLLDAPEPPDAA